MIRTAHTISQHGRDVKLLDRKEQVLLQENVWNLVEKSDKALL